MPVVVEVVPSLQSTEPEPLADEAGADGAAGAAVAGAGLVAAAPDPDAAVDPAAVPDLFTPPW